MALVRSNDWARVARDMRDKAIRLFGIDELASALHPNKKAVPYTPPGYGLEMLREWNTIITKAWVGIEDRKLADVDWGDYYFSGNSTKIRAIFGTAIIFDYRSLEDLYEDFMENTGTSAAPATAFQWLKRQAAAAKTMLTALADTSSIRVGPGGHPTMESVGAAMFWEANTEMAVNMGGWSVDLELDGVFWESVGQALKELPDVLRKSIVKTGHVVGCIAGETLKIAGEILGAGIGGLVSGLGLQDVLIAGGAAVVAYKVVL